MGKCCSTWHVLKGDDCADAPVIANPGEMELAKKLIERVRYQFFLRALCPGTILGLIMYAMMSS